MTTPRIRAALDALPSYKPGKPPLAGDRPTYKLSSNENPYPPLPGVLEAANAAASRFNRYPDMAMPALHAALSDSLGVDVDRLASGTGSVAVLYHLLQATCTEGDEVVYAWRSFEAYPIAVGLTGATSVRVPLTPDHRHDLAAMRSAITDSTRVVIVCTPNNPTGPAVSRAELLEFVDAVPSDVLVVVDEAYREFVTAADPLDGLEVAAGRDNVVVLRTFSKAHGLAGLRVGYGVASPRIAEAIRKCALPFGVSQVAQDAAVASIGAVDELMERVASLVTERQRVVAELEKQGWQLPDTQANFVWLPLGARTVAFAQACEQAGVVVRPFADEGARVTIGEPEANDIFLSVAADWV